MDAEVYRFDAFRLDVPERRFWRGDELLPLRDKVFDTLVLLVRGAGRLQAQQDLIEELWPDVSVEPNNLQHNVSILRKALAGSSVEIETVRGRGYRLLAEVTREPSTEPEEVPPVTPSARLQPQEIHFCQTEDGVSLAWASVGNGPPVIKAGNWCSHLEIDRSSFVWHHLLASLSESHRLFRYDPRGNGLSDWDPPEVSFERWVGDLETVVDATGIDRFPLVGVSQGAAVATAYAARHPERVSALVLVSGLVRGWRVKGNPKVITHFESLVSLLETGWGRDNPAYRQLFSTAFFPTASKEALDGFNELQRRSASPQMAMSMLATIGDIDIRTLAPQVRAPTLVLHGRNDMVIPFRDGQELAATIPGARFVPLDTRNHIPMVDDPTWLEMDREIRDFLAAHGAS